MDGPSGHYCEVFSIDRPPLLAVGRLLRQAGGLDLEATELAIRASLHEVGGVLLAKLLNSDGGVYKGLRVACRAGHQASFIDYRYKEVTTVPAVIAVKRAYYHCAACAAGVIPKDQALDIVGTSFSPGVRRLMGRVGGKESFEDNPDGKKPTIEASSSYRKTSPDPHLSWTRTKSDNPPPGPK
jgi:hypothetical protein